VRCGSLNFGLIVNGCDETGVASKDSFLFTK
jgi:hypothetical protein